MREIVLDVETTGLWVKQGHRVIEVACIELHNQLPTGRMFHSFVNPGLYRMPQESFEIHGISAEFLRPYPPFGFVVDALLEFIGDDQLVIHNAAFDIAFINYELSLLYRLPLANPAIDTLSMARKQFTNAANSLDALCRRFKIDLAARKLHGAGVDCALLAAVYLELIGGRQHGLGLFDERSAAGRAAEIVIPPPGPYRPARAHPIPCEAERAAHAEMLSRIDNPLWLASLTDADLDDEIPF